MSSPPFNRDVTSSQDSHPQPPFKCVSLTPRTHISCHAVITSLPPHITFPRIRLNNHDVITFHHHHFLRDTPPPQRCERQGAPSAHSSCAWPHTIPSTHGWHPEEALTEWPPIWEAGTPAIIADHPLQPMADRAPRTHPHANPFQVSSPGRCLSGVTHSSANWAASRRLHIAGVSKADSMGPSEDIVLLQPWMSLPRPASSGHSSPDRRSCRRLTALPPRIHDWGPQRPFLSPRVWSQLSPLCPGQPLGPASLDLQGHFGPLLGTGAPWRPPGGRPPRRAVSPQAP